MDKIRDKDHEKRKTTFIDKTDIKHTIGGALYPISTLKTSKMCSFRMIPLLTLVVLSTGSDFSGSSAQFVRAGWCFLTVWSLVRICKMMILNMLNVYLVNNCVSFQFCHK